MATVHPPIPPGTNSSVWDRISTWVSENKAVIYTIAGVAVVVTGAGAVYYVGSASLPPADSGSRPSKKERRRRKQVERDAEAGKTASSAKSAALPSVATVEEADDLPKIDAEFVVTLSSEERQTYAKKLKERGNKAYGIKEFDRAIELYSQAILCKPDPVFYSNRSACYNARREWDKVVEDTTAALNFDPKYIKALNRRANAYDQLEQYSEALLDYTASCIIEEFRNAENAQAVERLLKVFAEKKAKEVMRTRAARLPSSTFVANYLQSFRPKPRPAGLDGSMEWPEGTGKGQLQLGLKAMEKKTGEGYEEAGIAFNKAVELNELGEFTAFAYNMRGTFRCLRGQHEDAIADLTKSIELDPAMTQSYIKRASMNLELGKPQPAEEDFAFALDQNPEDPDVYYHRAQFHFIKGDYTLAAKDYQKSIDLDTNFIFSHIQLGVTQYKMGSVASSMATFRRCIKNFPDVPDVYNYFGELLLDQNKFQEAIGKFDKAMELEKASKPLGINVLPLINKALAIFQSKHDFFEVEKLCDKALILDPDCDIAVATMAQLLLQQGKVIEALKYFERAAELARTEGELVNALTYAEATRTQLQVQEKYPDLAAKLSRGPGMV